MMSQRSKQELTAEIHARYLKASKTEKMLYNRFLFSLNCKVNILHPSVSIR